MVSYFLHHAELWESALLTVVSMLMMLWQYKTQYKFKSFIVFLMFIVGYYVYRLPFLANHSNLILFTSVFLLISLFKANKDNVEQIFERLRPSLCLSLAVVYILAGFHKLNYDFFNIEASCATESVRWYLWHYGLMEFNIPEWILYALPVLTIVIEIVGGLFLLIPMYRYWGLVMLTGMHVYLSPVSIYDFTSVCLAFMLCFLPLSFIQTHKKALNRLVSYYIGAVIIGAIGVVLQKHFHILGDLDAPLVLSWPFTVFYLYLIYTLIFKLKLYTYKTDLKLFEWKNAVLPLLLLIFGLLNYFGLRTAGNFTMFSNVRTEGHHSNHFVMPESFKLFDYQDKLVFIVELDEKYSDHINFPTSALYVTEFELKRYVQKWKNKGLKVPITVQIDDRMITYEDITTVKRWNTDVPSYLNFKLQLFRPVQNRYEANYCRW